jgi:hypothetical protein
MTTITIHEANALKLLELEPSRYREIAPRLGKDALEIADSIMRKKMADGFRVLCPVCNRWVKSSLEFYEKVMCTRCLQLSGPGGSRKARKAKKAIIAERQEKIVEEQNTREEKQKGLVPLPDEGPEEFVNRVIEMFSDLDPLGCVLKYGSTSFAVYRDKREIVFMVGSADGELTSLTAFQLIDRIGEA